MVVAWLAMKCLEHVSHKLIKLGNTKPRDNINMFLDVFRFMLNQGKQLSSFCFQINLVSPLHVLSHMFLHEIRMHNVDSMGSQPAWPSG